MIYFVALYGNEIELSFGDQRGKYQPLAFADQAVRNFGEFCINVLQRNHLADCIVGKRHYGREVRLQSQAFEWFKFMTARATPNQPQRFRKIAGKLLDPWRLTVAVKPRNKRTYLGLAKNILELRMIGKPCLEKRLEHDRKNVCQRLCFPRILRKIVVVPVDD